MKVQDTPTLLLTSCIDVCNKALVKRNDTATRLQDYQTALRKWLKKQDAIDRIVFVDNSGYALDSLKTIAKNENPQNKTVEFLSFVYTPEGDANISLGELSIIDYALKHSALLKTSQSFIKVTGRVFVPNIDRIVRGVFPDFHAVSLLSENLCYADSAIVAFNTEFYKDHVSAFAMGAVKNTNSSKMDMERAFALAIHRGIAQDFRWYPFPVQPIIDGFSGTKNMPYRNRRVRAWMMTAAARLYHFFYRNTYDRGRNRKHLLDRWHIDPRA